MHNTIPPLLLLLPSTSAITRAAFLQPHQNHAAPRIRTTTSLINAYGKGSEIWPECNEEPIALTASFPDGIIPEVALNVLAKESSNDALSTTGATKFTSTSMKETTNVSTKTSGAKRRAIKQTLSHLLHSAAKASSRRAANSKDGSEATAVIDKAPGIMALLLLGFNCVSVRHVLSVLLLSVYLIGVASWCAAPRLSSSGIEDVNMAALPSKGHVPN